MKSDGLHKTMYNESLPAKPKGPPPETTAEKPVI